MTSVSDAPSTSADNPTVRPYTMTSTDEIDSTMIRPGSVKINVKGAFIVDPDAATPALNGVPGRISPTHHETSDIRLPNHTAVVSHIAVDVSGGQQLPLRAPCACKTSSRADADQWV